MDMDWLEKQLLDKPHTVKRYHEDFKADRYLVGEKMFAMVGADKQGRPIITLKLHPSTGEILRQQYQDIVPGYYMNKLHWNSLYLEGEVPQEVLCQMIDESYQILFSSLPKKLQRELQEL